MVALTLNNTFTENAHNSGLASVAPIFIPILDFNNSSIWPFKREDYINATQREEAEEELDIDIAAQEETLEPAERRAQRNMFKVGVLDAATKRALYADSGSLGKFSIGLEEEEQEEEHKKDLDRLMNFVLENINTANLDANTKSSYIQLGNFLYEHKALLSAAITALSIDLFNGKVHLEELTRHYQEQTALFQSTQIQAQDIEQERDLAEQERIQAEQDRIQAEQDLQSAREQLEIAKRQLELMSERVATDFSGNVVYVDEATGQSYYLNEQQEREYYSFLHSKVLELTNYVTRATVTGDEIEENQEELARVEENVSEAQQQLHDCKRHEDVATRTYEEINERYLNIQEYLEELENNLTEMEQEMSDQAEQNDVMQQRLNALQITHNRLDSYIDRYNDPETIQALEDGSLTIEQLINDMPPAVRIHYNSMRSKEQNHDPEETELTNSVDGPQNPYKVQAPIPTPHFN